ncbi:GAF domain-containing protein [Sphingomonas gei]|uniref:GAF domain-containing protein n=1 Tax=Sphingomonas gei TaxID=1395960 RepID=A0A4S1XCU9_9SPHN|nr:GAF domain-containing protein [Sphingomonas gei]TGX54289.1 GAF domain-containing protein [Sphingomonas gei]
MGAKDDLAAMAVLLGDDDALRKILALVCEQTQMGFAAVARVTDDRWIACQVLDKIEFGLDPGDELEVKTTICDDIRACGEAVIIDSVIDDPKWRKHHTPQMYGFESYASLPVYLDDRSFFGTLCAIDPEPRQISGQQVITALRGFAGQVGSIMSARIREQARAATAA